VVLVVVLVVGEVIRVIKVGVISLLKEISRK
jgi:hypothetical protein